MVVIDCDVAPIQDMVYSEKLCCFLVCRFAVQLSRFNHVFGPTTNKL